MPELPRIRKDSKQYYSKIYKSIKGMATFNYGRRTKFTRGEKAAISKVYNEARRARDLKFVKMPKHKNESASAYRKRLTHFQRDHAQDGLPVKGIFLNLPSKGKYELRKTFTKVTTGNRVDKIFPIGNLKLELTEESLQKMIVGIVKIHHIPSPYIVKLIHSRHQSPGKKDDKLVEQVKTIIAVISKYAGISGAKTNAEKAKATRYIANAIMITYFTDAKETDEVPF